MRPIPHAIAAFLVAFPLASPPALAAAGSGDGAALIWEATVSAGGGSTLSLPVAIASQGDGGFAVADAEPPRLIYGERTTAGWTLARSVRLPAPPSGLAAVNGGYFVSLRESGALYFLGPEDAAPRRIALPRGAFAGALAPDGRGGLAVLDLAGRRALRLSPAGAKLGEFAVPKGTRRLWPVEGGWLALLPAEGRLEALGADGSSGESLLLPGDAPRPCWPSALAVDQDGSRWILDRSGARLMVLDPEGRPRALTGRRGWQEGRMLYPADLALLGGGHVAVIDQLNRRIQVFRYLPEESAR